MSGFSYSGYGGTGYSYGSTTAKDYEVDTSKGPEDTISQLKFAINGSDLLLFATSWDGSVNAWKKVDPTTQNANPKWELISSHRESRHACLRITTDENSNRYFFGTTEGAVKQITLTQGENKFNVTELFKLVVPYPVAGLAFCQDKNCLVVGGMNGTVYLYDSREKAQPNACLVSGSYNLVSLDVGVNTAYVAYADMMINSIDIRQPLDPVQQPNIPELKFNNIQKTYQEMQLTTIAAYPQDDGFMSGSVTGRVVIIHGSNYKQYDIHRNETDYSIYSCNCVSIAKRATLGVSCGGDGALNYFNLSNGLQTNSTETKAKEKIPYTACALSPDADFCAYSSGEDWSRGYEEHENTFMETKLFVHKITDHDKGIKKTVTSGSYGYYGNKTYGTNTK